jgi:hypothetical protein
MVEQDQSRPNGQAALELTRLNEVEGFIEFKATDLSMGDPMFAEDLAQQAREAVIKRLRKHPDCPYSHLVNKARDALYNYRKKGHSVDRPYQGKRARQYQFASLEEPVNHRANFSARATALGEILNHPTQPKRFTEERAITRVLYDTVRDQLPPRGNSALTLRLSGFSWREIRQTLNLSHGELGMIKKDLAQRVQRVWGHNP